MRKTSVSMTENNYKKIKDHQINLRKNNTWKVTFSDALNDIVENIK